MVAIYGRDGIAPGRVVNLGYNLRGDDGVNRQYPWFYVVAIVGDIVSGVLFDGGTDARTARPTFYGTTFDAIGERNGALTSTATHPLSVVDWWPDAVAQYLATPDRFPGVTLPSVAPPPEPDLSGESIPRSVIVAKLEEASRVASDYADRNELCGEFERCMESIGLEELGLRSLRERERYYAVEYTREVEGECPECGHERETTERATVYLYVTARDDDHAYDRVVDIDDEFASYLTGWDQDTSDVELTRA